MATVREAIRDRTSTAGMTAEARRVLEAAASMAFPTEAETVLDPDTPAALMVELLAAVGRTLSAPACGSDGNLTPYGDLAHQQLGKLIDQFACSNGTNVGDALAFSLVAGRVLTAFSGTALAGNPDWNLYIYAIGLLDRMQTCLRRVEEAEAQFHTLIQ